jgi:His/Glu/Gln/Arg/opine family amino acid ABC transporter permease subunit|tara:strand:+ start:36 stop:1856 length:1821 start_codon:yes stop_codon:yes gene_type:complete
LIENLTLVLILFLFILPFLGSYLSNEVFSHLRNFINYSLFASIYFILADAFVESTLLNLTPGRIQDVSFGFNVLPEAVEGYTLYLTSIIAIGIALGLFLLQSGNITPKRYELSIQALAIFAFLPFILYFWTHILYLKENDSSWVFDLTFMEEMAGFTLSNEWPFDTVLQDSRWQFYRVGLFNAIRVVILSIIGSTIVGVIIGVSRLSRNRLLSGLAESYVEFFRNMPLVVQLFFLYTVVLGANLPIFQEIQENTLFGWVYWSNRGIVGPGAGIENMPYFLAAFAVYLGARTYIRYSERIPGTKSVDIWNPILLIPILNWWSYIRDSQSKVRIKANSKFSLVVDIIFSLSVLIVIYGLFNAVEWNYKISTLEGILENDPLSMFKLGIIMLVLSSLLRFKFDELGLNNFTIDDSTESQRNRSILWGFTISFMFIFFYLAIWLKQPNLIICCDSNGNELGWGLWKFEEGSNQTISSVFLSLWIGLTLYTAAQIAEIVRGSIQSLPRGQVEAAISLGLSPYQRLKLVILPQALRSMIPSMTNQYLNCWKNSSLAFVVGFSDFYAVFSTIVNNAGQAVPVFIMILATYQAGSLTISAIMNYINSNVTKVKI